MEAEVNDQEAFNVRAFGEDKPVKVSRKELAFH